MSLTSERFPGVTPDDAALIEAIYQRAFDALHAAIFAVAADPSAARASRESYTLRAGADPHPSTPDHLSGLGHGKPTRQAHLSLIQHGGWQAHATALQLDCSTLHLLLDGRDAPRAEWGRGVTWSADWERALSCADASPMAHLWRSPQRAWFSLAGWRYDLSHPLLWLISPKEPTP